MKQEVCILPVQCEKCGGVFDLWYDLHEQSESSVKLSQELRMKKQSLCWKCRQYEKVFNDQRTSNDETELTLDFE